MTEEETDGLEYNVKVKVEEAKCIELLNTTTEIEGKQQ